MGLNVFTKNEISWGKFHKEIAKFGRANQTTNSVETNPHFGSSQKGTKKEKKHRLVGGFNPFDKY